MRQSQHCLPPQKGPHKSSQLASTSVIPEHFRSLFAFEHFNSMQTASLEAVYHSGENVVVSSPTGSGKTVLFELAMVRLFTEKLAGEAKLENCKVLYIAPTKALCSEKYNDWNARFSVLGISVGMLTSDTNSAETWRVKQSDILICTPEKWDVLTRRWFDYKRLLELVKLICIDEVHVLNCDRGATLEVVATRMKTLCCDVRFIALSATVPNLADVALWLRKQAEIMTPAIALEFGEDHRAVRLDKIVNGYSTTYTNDFMFEKYLNIKLIECINTFSKSKPTLIFCPTRASCTQTVKFLYDNMRGLHGTGNIKAAGNRDLDSFMEKGIAYHHAGLSFEERKVVEENFKNGSLHLICSTSTLAVGVNLPVYCVIIKGTKTWSNVGLQEYSILDVLQMMGRAGRPQFETSGVAILMTQQKDKYKYDRFVHGKEKLESCLHKNLIENLAAEVVLGTVISVESAVRWMRSTFFYTRYIRNPGSYPEIQESVGMAKDNLKSQLTEFCEKNLELLVKEELAVNHEGVYQGTKYGQAMSQHYVLFRTMTLWMHKKSPENISEVLDLLCDALEWADVRLRHNEKRLLKEINTAIRFPILEKNIDKTSQKVSIVIQYELGCLEYPSYEESKRLHASFLTDKMAVLKQAPRLLKCMIDIFVKREDVKALMSAFELLRCINGKCWENTSMELRQIDGVGPVSVRKFASHGINSLRKAKTLSMQQLEYIMGARPGGATRIKKDIDLLPQLELDVRIIASMPATKGMVVDVQFEIKSTSSTHTFHGKPLCVSIITTTNQGVLVDFRRLFLKKLEGSKNATVRARICSSRDSILVDAFFDDIAGIQVRGSVDISHLKGWEILEQIELDRLEAGSFSGDSEMEEFIMEVTPVTANRTLPTQDDTSVENRTMELAENMIECHHTCKDKTKCRHICCRTGIPSKENPPQITECKHKCKDKANCRHMCCNEWADLIPETPVVSSKPKLQNERALKKIVALSTRLTGPVKRSLFDSDSEEEMMGLNFLDPRSRLRKKKQKADVFEIGDTLADVTVEMPPSCAGSTPKKVSTPRVSLFEHEVSPAELESAQTVSPTAAPSLTGKPVLSSQFSALNLFASDAEVA